MPNVYEYLHYQNMDVSSFKRAFAFWTSIRDFKKNYNHRAMDDIIESIKELKHYKKIMCRNIN